MKGTSGLQSAARFPSNPPPTHTPASISCFSALACHAVSSAYFEIRTEKVPQDCCHVNKLSSPPFEAEGSWTEIV